MSHMTSSAISALIYRIAVVAESPQLAPPVRLTTLITVYGQLCAAAAARRAPALERIVMITIIIK